MAGDDDVFRDAQFLNQPVQVRHGGVALADQDQAVGQAGLPLQPGERPLGVNVRGVLRQDGRHDLIDDRQLGLGHESTLVGPQPSLHLPDALGARRPHRPDPCRGGRCWEAVLVTGQLLA